jgi:hypothetical protein
LAISVPFLCHFIGNVNYLGWTDPGPPIFFMLEKSATKKRQTGHVNKTALKLDYFKSVEKYFVPMRIAMSLLSDWVSLQKKAAMNVLLGKSSLFRKRPDGLAFQHSGKFSIFFF